MTGFLYNTPRVTIQLSNLCPWSDKHPLCFAGKREAQILSGHVVRDILRTLSDIWTCPGQKILAWHMFNEPVIDPRLATFLADAKFWLPNVKQLVWTNGWYLTKELACELVDYGMGWLQMSHHNGNLDAQQEIGRAVREKGCAFGLTFKHFDKRMLWKDEERPAPPTPCWAPLAELVIRSSGNLGLCCYDCEEEVTFGNVKDGFLAALTKAYPRMKSWQNRLITGVRNERVCIHCQRERKGKVVCPPAR